MKERHHLVLRYDGRLASEHEMDAGDSHAIIEGAKRLLSASGYYWATGQVPDRVFSETDAFHVRHIAMRAGSCEYEFTINLLANGVYDAARVAFEVFLIKAFLDWKDRRALEVPIHARREPYFDPIPPNRSNAPDYAFEPDPEVQYGRLMRRYQQSMHQISAPLGKHADTLDVTLGGKHLGTWATRVPRWTDDEITEAVHSFRSSRASSGPLS